MQMPDFKSPVLPLSTSAEYASSQKAATNPSAIPFMENMLGALHLKKLVWRQRLPFRKQSGHNQSNSTALRSAGGTGCPTAKSAAGTHGQLAKFEHFCAEQVDRRTPLLPGPVVTRFGIQSERPCAFCGVGEKGLQEG